MVDSDDERSAREAARVTELALLRHQQLHPPLVGESLMECEECGNKIPPERRRALPGVRLCIECKRAEEFLDKGL